MSCCARVLGCVVWSSVIMGTRELGDILVGVLIGSYLNAHICHIRMFLRKFELKRRPQFGD